MASAKNSAGYGSIVSVLLGPLCAGLFYGVLYLLPDSIAHRYFMGHPVAYAATILFWVAVVGLSILWLSAHRELQIVSSLANSRLKPASFESDRVEDRVDAWLNHFSKLTRADKFSKIVIRMEELLTRQKRRGNARLLNADLQEISDRDADSAHDSLQLVRIIVWAIPMLGFLGTVIGITQTLGGLDFTEAQNAVDKLKAGLYVAFDTTALGLVLSVVAIFLQFPVEKKLGLLTHTLDDRVGELLAGSFIEEANANEPLIAVAEMNRAVLASVNRLVETQAELWKKTVDSAHEHWATVVGSAGDQIQSALANAIDDSLLKHAAYIEKAQDTASGRTEERWKQWQTALGENARILLAQQQALAEQNEFLSASGTRAKEIVEIRALLDQNNASLESAPEMSDAMRSLAKAIDTLVQRVPASTSAGRAA